MPIIKCPKCGEEYDSMYSSHSCKGGESLNDQNKSKPNVLKEKKEQKIIPNKKKRFFQFFVCLKNPLWIIVILLIMMNFLLWNISQNIGHDYVLSQRGTIEVRATGLYKVIYGKECPDFNSGGIIDVLKDIYYKF